MSYTNTTPNYELPQYIASDKPTYLGDMNSAYAKIDSTMAENASKTSSASELAKNAKQTVDELEPKVSTNTVNITQLTGNVATLNNLVNTMTNTVTTTPVQAGTRGLGRATIKSNNVAVNKVKLNDNATLVCIYGGTEITPGADNLNVEQVLGDVVWNNMNNILGVDKSLFSILNSVSVQYSADVSGSKINSTVIGAALYSGTDETKGMRVFPYPAEYNNTKLYSNTDVVVRIAFTGLISSIVA